jgi:hypothetical protein
MAVDRSDTAIPLPKGWPGRVRSAVLHVLSLARVAYASARGWAACHANRRVRNRAGLERCQQELALLREELRIKYACMVRVPPHQGPQVGCDGFREWCGKRNVKPRFGAVGRHGSIAVIERLILTLKQGIGWLPLVPLRRGVFLRELQLLAAWYNSHRPHMSVDGRTPDEVYHALRPANRQPRFEPRPRWPQGSPCAKPVTPLKGRPGAQVRMEVAFLNGWRHLPVVRLQRAA